VYTASAIGEPSSASRAATAHTDDPGLAATEEAVGEAVHPAPARAPIYTGPT